MDLSFQITRKLLRFCNHVISTRSERLQRFNLTSSQSEALQFFCRNEGATATDLKKHLDISHQAARNMVERMKEKKLLYSRVSEDDARSKKIYCTESAMEIYNMLESDASEAGIDLLSILSDKEKEDLYRIIEKLNSGF